MDKNARQLTPATPASTALKITLIYVCLSGLWIFWSDSLIFGFFRNIHDLHLVNTWKGLLFIGVTAALLYFMIRFYVVSIVDHARITSGLNARLEQFMDASPVVCFTFKVKGDEVVDHWVSNNLHAMVWSDAVISLTQDNLRAVVHPEDYDRVWSTLCDGLKYFRAVDYSCRLRDPEGDYRWFQVQIRPVAVSQNGIRELAATLTDVTTIKNLDEQRAEAQVWHSLLFEQVNTGICIHDDNFQAIELNSAFAGMLGADDTESLLGLYPWDWDANFPDRGTFLEAQQSLPELFETRWRRRDGNVIDVEISLAKINYNGRQRYVTICSDISAQKAAQQQLVEYSENLSWLVTLSTELRNAADRQGIFDMLVEHLNGIYRTSAVAIAMISDDRRRFIIRAASGAWLQYWRHEFEINDFLGEEILDNTGVYLSSDYSRQTNFPNHTMGLGPALFMPLATDGDPLGLLAVGRPEGSEFSAQEINLLCSIGEIAGIAIHRVKLLEDIERRLKYREILRNINMAVAGSLDFGVVLQIALKAMIEQLEVSAAMLLEPNYPMKELVLIGSEGFGGEEERQAALARALDHSRQALELGRPVIMAGEQGATPAVDAKRDPCMQCIPLIAKGRARGVLCAFYGADKALDPEWSEVLGLLGKQLAIAMDNASLFNELQQEHEQLLHAYDATLEGWARALALREKETEEHSRAVVDLTLKVARHMGLRGDDLVALRRGALLHDIGKIAIPDSVLLKEGPLTEEEWQIMRKHPEYAHTLLAPVRYLREALDIPYSHHERWDGSGYPRGLKGEEIPLDARIFSVVDVYDALTRDRKYKKGWAEDEALSYIREKKGSEFDPVVVNAFLEVKAAGVKAAG